VSGTTTDFTIQLPETLVIEGGQHKARIDNLRIPVTVPTISTGSNDTFVVKLGGTSYSVALPQGNYDGPTLAAALQGLLQAAAPGAWTVTYDINNIAMAVSCTNAFTITGGTYAAQIMSRPYTQTSNSYKFTFVTVSVVAVTYH